MKNYLLRFKNVGTVMAIVGLGGLLANQLGYKVDTKWLNETTNIICTIFVGLGVMNNPTTPKIDLPFIQEKEIKPVGEITDFRG